MKEFKKIERLKTSRESNLQKETIGIKLTQFRNKINEIVDHLNHKQEMKECVNDVMEEIFSGDIDQNEVIEED